jgi:hypothetical protein
MTRSISTWLAASLLVLAAAPARAGDQFNGVNMNGVNMNGVNMNGVNMNGVNMNGVNMNGVVLGAVTANATLEGDLLTVNLVDAGSTCSHSPGATGPALPASCSPCAQLVESQLASCGSSYWDSTCVARAESVCKLSGAQLVGTVFNGTLGTSTPVQLRLDGVTQAPLRIPSVNRFMSAEATISFGSDVYWYTWSMRRQIVRPPVGLEGRIVLNNWVPACPSTDRDGKYNLSILAAGKWVGIEPDPNNPGQVRNDCQPGDNCGGYTPSAGFTIACRDVGAVAKCIDRMGYKPWRTATRCTPSGTCADVSLAPYLEACVRMVRADYCGDGTTHTSNGTAIDVIDNVGLQSRDPAQDWFPEAQWSPTGAVCMSNYRIINPATGAPYGDIISSGSCLHRPRVSESSNISCAVPMSQPQLSWPGVFGGLIGDRSSLAE